MAVLRITSVRFSRYKAFDDFQIALQDFNVLVGPNNAGKSTIISAFRILAEGMRRARARSPERIDVPTFSGLGYRININELPIASENIFFDYDDSTPAQIKFRLSNGNHLRLLFPEQRSCILIAESNGKLPRTPSQFKADFDFEIGFVPILGPVDQKESLYAKEAARLALLTSGASRNFRNIWYHYPEGFDSFRQLIKTTWPGMDIEPPELSPNHRDLAMFCPEDRHPREICWAGYGFQVWCQMLTHVVKASKASLLVIDEPDIYLHSDLQRQLVSLLRELGPDILIATHSTEIIVECEPNNLVNISKKNKSAQRVKDISQLKLVFSALGSNLNPILTQLSKTKRVVFVEGLDFQIISVFARVLGYQRVANRSDFAVVKIEGFNPKRAVDLTSGIEATVGSNIARAVILDRDYRPESEIIDVTKELQKHGFMAHIHKRKEIENYLLDKNALERAIDSRLIERARRSGTAKQELPDVEKIIEDAMKTCKHSVFGQIQARAVEFSRKKTPHIDQATITEEISREFEEQWSSSAGRLALVPGKEVLASINAALQSSVGISVSDGQIVGSFKPTEVHQDIKNLIDELGKFSTSNNQ
uniref:ATPase AAA-type core domain-containing protein n=1 Tax=Dechloromonas aromatica (strain RCB) TaxID=159087 RepID=Q47H18_DECAR